MNYTESVLAQRYAQAYLNLYIDSISYKDFRAIRDAGLFFAKNRHLLFFLNWPAIKKVTKITALQQALEYCQVPSSINHLVVLLAAHKRMFLITKILEYICALYEKKHAIAQVTISSSHPMTDQQLKVMQQFLAHKTGLSIIYDYKIDKKLIAGIRMQSNTFLWEHSINQQLENIKLPLIR
jgi:F-type H+-transporting ATPase subunit delta